MRLAELSAREGNLERAEFYLQEVRGVVPDDLRTAEELIAVLGAAGKTEPAVKLNQEWLGRFPQRYFLLEQVGKPDLHHLGDDAVSIVKACSAVKGNDDKASDKLDSVGSDARGDLGYVLCRIQYLMRKDKLAEATRVLLAAPADGMALQDTDEWWRVRRILARRWPSQFFRSLLCGGERPARLGLQIAAPGAPGIVDCRRVTSRTRGRDQPR